MNKKIYNRARKVLDIARERAECLPEHQVRNVLEGIQLYTEGYAELGYSNSDCGVVACGNWNSVTKWNGKHLVIISDLPARICNIFEKLGVGIEWNDEWANCSLCSKLVRTSGDSYSWQPSYTIFDGEINCHECIKKDPSDHLENLEGYYDKCNTIKGIDPSNHNYVKLNHDFTECVDDCGDSCEFESGWYVIDDDSRTVAKILQKKGLRRFMFNLERNEQFRSVWSVYIHNSEVGLLSTK